MRNPEQCMHSNTFSYIYIYIYTHINIHMFPASVAAVLLCRVASVIRALLSLSHQSPLHRSCCRQSLGSNLSRQDGQNHQSCHHLSVRLSLATKPCSNSPCQKGSVACSFCMHDVGQVVQVLGQHLITAQ